MANIAKRPDGRWRARYRDAHGTEHARHFTRKIDAQDWLDDVAVAVRTGTYIDPAHGKITLGDWSERWLATKIDLKATTRRTYEGLLRKHILPAWKSVKLIDVTHEGIATWVATLSAYGLSASTVRQTHRVLSLILTLAVRDGRLVRNPAAQISMPHAAKSDQLYLTHTQVDALAREAGDFSLVILFLSYTGVRYGEMAAVRVQEVDLIRRRVHIRAAVADVNGRAVFSTPKNHQQRNVPIPRFMVDDLAEHIAGKAPNEFVFSAPRGGVLHLRNFRRTTFDPAARSAGLAGLTPHALRHTAASLAIAAGANVKVVQTMLGHKSATMTLDLYGHLLADQLDDVAEAMDAARAAASLSRPDAAVVDLIAARGRAGE